MKIKILFACSLRLVPTVVVFFTGAARMTALPRVQQAKGKETSATPTQASTKQPLSAFTICIDPGHSKKTLGAHGHNVYEYQICWQIAKKLEAQLQKEGATVLLTKQDGDQEVANVERATIANKAHADLLLRLHCDAGPDTGIATFYPDTQGTAEGKTGPSRDVLTSSKRCAYALHPALLKVLGKSLQDRGIRTDRQTYVGSQQGGALTGSIFSEVPVVLVEMCVITNRKDEEFIQSPSGQKKMAAALASGARAAVEANKSDHTTPDTR